MSLSRRTLLRALPAMPVAAKTVMGAVVEKLGTLQSASIMGSVGMHVGQNEAPVSWGLKRIVSNPLLAGMKKLGILPDWVHREIHNEICNQHWHIDPDVGSLRSVSLSAKFFVMRRRRERRVWDDAIQNAACDLAREAFFKQNSTLQN